MKVLLTGFQPFDGETMNPSYEAVKLVADNIGEKQVIKREMPCVYGKAIEAIKQAMDEVKPDVVICVGQAGGRFDITPERVAININDARVKDNAGNMPEDEIIEENGPAAYFSTLPVRAMVKNMKEASIPSSVSNTAGTFVCNNIMYGLLHITHTEENYKRIKGGFIHVPYCNEQVLDKPGKAYMPVEMIAKGLCECIKAL